VLYVVKAYKRYYVAIEPASMYMGNVVATQIQNKQSDSIISGAYFKIKEAFDVLKESWGWTLRDNAVAVDVGASPGGWSAFLCEQGARVLAIDPGELKIPAHPRLIHVSKLLEQSREDIEKLAPADVVVCDMNVHPKLACALMVTIMDLLNENGVLVLTLKTIEHGLANYLERLPEVILKPTGLFNSIETRWLFANGKERTCLARRSSLKKSKEELVAISKEMTEADPYVLLGLKTEKGQADEEMKTGDGEEGKSGKEKEKGKKAGTVATKRKLNKTVHSWLKQQTRQHAQQIAKSSVSENHTAAPTDSASNSTSSGVNLIMNSSADLEEKPLSKRQQRKMQRRQEVVNRILAPSSSSISHA